MMALKQQKDYEFNKKIISFFKPKVKDSYLEYLKKSTNKNWVSYIDNSYLCESKNFYLKIEGEKAKCTRQANLLFKTFILKI